MAEIIRQYNRRAGENQSLIKKALTAATGSGEALVPQQLEQAITNAIPRLSVALSMITAKYAPGKLYEYNRLTGLPTAGSAVGESSITPIVQPTFQRANKTLKIFRKKGATTDFLADASRGNAQVSYDAAAANIEATMLSFIYDMEHYTLFGNESANAYEFSGLDTLVTTNRINKGIAGVVPTSLKELDDLIDANLDNQGYDHKKAFVMSPYMLSKFSQLLTNVRLNQGMSGQMSQVDVPGGWRLNAYRDIPIIMSSACRPKTVMGTVTPTTATTTGSIADASYNSFVVSAVTTQGEQLGARAANIATTGGGASTVTLSFSAVTGAIKYKVYFQTGTSGGGAETLISVVPAQTYDATGAVAGSISNTINTNSIITSGADGNVTSIKLFTVAAHTEVPTAMQSDYPLMGTLSTGVIPEYVFLWDLDEIQGMGRMAYTNQGTRMNGLVTIEELAKTDAYLPFMLTSHCALIDSFEKTSAVIRGLKVQ